MPRCSAWTKRSPSRPWIARIRFCRCPRTRRTARLGVLRTATLSLYAATFNTNDREVLAKRLGGPHLAEFVAVPSPTCDRSPRGKEIHGIADNLSAHKSRSGHGLPGGASKVILHFTPTSPPTINRGDTIARHQPPSPRTFQPHRGHGSTTNPRSVGCCKCQSPRLITP